MTEDTDNILVELATELTIAWLGNPNTRVTTDDVPIFLRSMHAAIHELSAQSGEPSAALVSGLPAAAHVPAVSARRSLASKDHIISLIDGKPYKTLRRHLSTHGLTPEQYRERYKLKADYPMVAETYSQARRAMAVKIGLGNKGRAARTGGEEPVSPAKPAPKPRAKKTPA